MKNFLSFLLIFGFFLGSSFLSSANGGYEAMVVRGKIANALHTFELPNEKIAKGNIKVTLFDSSNNVVFSQKTNNLNVVLPNKLSGTYFIVIDASGFVVSQKISL